MRYFLPQPQHFARPILPRRSRVSSAAAVSASASAENPALPTRPIAASSDTPRAFDLLLQQSPRHLLPLHQAAAPHTPPRSHRAPPRPPRNPALPSAAAAPP